MKQALFAACGLLFALALGGCSSAPAAVQTQPAAPASSAAPLANSAAAEETADGKKALVLYFSATGSTEKVALEIAAQTGADVVELLPEQPYTDEDLNYNNNACRANQEQNDPDARPALANSVDNLDEYDTVYLGFPIWWGTMPRVMNTLLDSYDFSGKTILPFCTSGGSGISSAVSAIRAAEPDADVRDGLRLSGSAANNCTDSVAAWLAENT